jgi:predicted nucleic acid-binding protein
LIESVKPVLDELMAQGKRISQQLYQEVLDMAKE